MNGRGKGFVVSAILYPLLVLFLALIMGLLAMSDARKRILDKMKLEISDSIFDDAQCSCDTILNKLNYLIKNGVGGGGSGGSYSHNVLGLNVKGYETPEEMPNVGNAIGDIAVITDVEVTSYYVSQSAPKDPKEGDVWIVQDLTSIYHITSDYSNIGISYVMQYIEDKWELKKAYVFDDGKWTLLYYVSLRGDGSIDLTNTDVNAEIVKEYSYTGEYQIFSPVFSGYYQIELWGAQGENRHSSYPGGLGAYTTGEIYLNAGEQLYVYVGGKGNRTKGGWNVCDSVTPDYQSYYFAASGGGATDVRLLPTSSKDSWNEFESLKSRIMVAAGGAGSGYYQAGSTLYYGKGGAGGGLVGLKGSTNFTNPLTEGGSQTLGGFRNGHGAGFGYSTSGTTYGTNTGGGGYYGGGSAWDSHDAAGGGSSYISGFTGCNSISEDSTSDNIIHTGSAYHYSGYYFLLPMMVDGEGYRWNQYVRESVSKMPTHDGTSQMIGNAGNGYAKITLKTVEIMKQSEVDDIRKNSETQWSYTFSGINASTGRYQIFTVPKRGRYQVELWGAQGQQRHGSYSPGKGGYTSGEIVLNAGDKLYIYVGEDGNNNGGGGWNGGGMAFDVTYYHGASGGGATDVRILPTSSSIVWDEIESLKSRIMVAAGGAGSGYYQFGSTLYYAAGGSAGGLTGLKGSTNYTNPLANGGTQTGPSLLFGKGGSGSLNSGGNGGGSGWYGGGGGSSAHDVAAGGSSYISGHAGCIGVKSDGTIKTDTYSTIADSVSYTEYQFTNTKMVDGAGYEWRLERISNPVGMPSPKANSTIMGNNSDGFAKITYLGSS